MASQGPLSAGTGANQTGVGAIAWSNPGNIVSSNNTRATAQTNGLSQTNYLKGTNFGFSIPSGSTIDGIIVEVERMKSGTGTSVKDYNIKIVKSDGSIGTTDKADTATNWPTTEAYKTYGSSSDLWGESWTYSDINDVDFGVVVVATIDGGGPKFMSVANVDHIRITVYYTAGGSSSPSIESDLIIYN